LLKNILKEYKKLISGQDYKLFTAVIKPLVEHFSMILTELCQ